jgi:hypothetical protein
LTEQKEVPDWFINLEYISWNGQYKDLHFIPNIEPERVILIDDREEYIKPDQKSDALRRLKAV